MFNHVGLLTLKDDATDAQIAGIGEALVALPGKIPGLVSAEFVRDAGVSEGNATVRFQMRFDSQAAWEGYRTHPEHVAVITNHIGPVIAGKAFVQYVDESVQSSAI